jgi:hypothetical protein
MVFLSTTTPGDSGGGESGTLKPMGSFVYAMPDVGVLLRLFPSNFDGFPCLDSCIAFVQRSSLVIVILFSIYFLFILISPMRRP